MTTTRTSPRRHLLLGISFVGVAIVGTGLGFVATAHSGTLPTDGDTVVVVESNHLPDRAVQPRMFGQDVVTPAWLTAPAWPSGHQ